MAFGKMQREALSIADRADRLGRHDLGEKIREELECYHWTAFDSRIAVAIDMTLDELPDANFEQVTLRVLELHNYVFEKHPLTIDQLRNYPKIKQYYSFSRKIKAKYERKE